MTYQDVLLLKKQFEGAKAIYLAAHPDEYETLDKRLAIDSLLQLTAKDSIASHASLVQEVADYVLQRIAPPKEIMSIREVAKYLDVSISYIYKLTSKGEIPRYKPMGKVCYFKREDIDNWIAGLPPKK